MILKIVNIMMDIESKQHALNYPIVELGYVREVQIINFYNKNTV